MTVLLFRLTISLQISSSIEGTYFFSLSGSAGLIHSIPISSLVLYMTVCNDYAALDGTLELDYSKKLLIGYGSFFLGACFAVWFVLVW